jgi:hypothetical protein
MSRLDLAYKLIVGALEMVSLMPKARELSLVTTKLEEALLWLTQYEVKHNG